MDSYNDIWELVRSYCREKVSETIYSLWLEPLELKSFEDDQVILSASDFKANIVRSKFKNLLAVLEACRKKAAVKAVCCDRVMDILGDLYAVKAHVVKGHVILAPGAASHLRSLLSRFGGQLLHHSGGV